jgi:hypothetical protein
MALGAFFVLGGNMHKAPPSKAMSVIFLLLPNRGSGSGAGLPKPLPLLWGLCCKIHRIENGSD